MRTDMPWPLVLGGTREVDEEDREVVKTAEVVVMEYVAGVTTGTTVDVSHNNTTSRHHRHIRSISRSNNNRTTSSQRSNNNSIRSRSNNSSRSNHSNIMVPRDFVRDADSSGTSQTGEWHPHQRFLAFSGVPSPRFLVWRGTRPSYADTASS